MADSRPPVTVIQPSERPAEARALAKEAALLSKIDQREDELAQLRRAAAPPPAYVAYAPQPAFAYADYGSPIVSSAAIYPWSVRSWKPHHCGLRGGHPERPGPVPYGARRGLNVSIRR